MNEWSGLQQTVVATLEAGRIGQPVFARCTVVLAEDLKKLDRILIRLVSDLAQWFAAVPGRVYALDSADEGHITTTLEYSSGATALLALSCHAPHLPPSGNAFTPPQAEVNLTVLGAKGAIYHHQHYQLFDLSQDDSLAPSAIAHGEMVVAAIEQSLKSKKPVDVDAAARSQGGTQL